LLVPHVVHIIGGNYTILYDKILYHAILESVLHCNCTDWNDSKKPRPYYIHMIYTNNCIVIMFILHRNMSVENTNVTGKNWF
jgi:hypothetical protein